MKTFSKIILVFLFFFAAIHSDAQATKRIYNDNEIILPNNLQYIETGENKTTIRGYIENNIVKISWQTKAEINTSHFELQRSQNGQFFEPIETITAGRISNNICSYATTDEQVNKSDVKLYYRLKLVFVNGRESFTEAIAVTVNNSASNAVYILP